MKYKCMRPSLGWIKYPSLFFVEWILPLYSLLNEISLFIFCWKKSPSMCSVCLFFTLALGNIAISMLDEISLYVICLFVLPSHSAVLQYLCWKKSPSMCSVCLFVCLLALFTLALGEWNIPLYSLLNEISLNQLYINKRPWWPGNAHLNYAK